MTKPVPSRRVDIAALRRPAIGLVLLSWVVLLAPGARAQTCSPTLTTVTIDGRFEDWEQVLRNPRNLAVDAFGNAPPCGSTGDRDCPGGIALDLRLLALTWDDENLYVFIERFGPLVADDPRYYHLAIDRADEQFFDATGPVAEHDLLLQFAVTQQVPTGTDELITSVFRLMPGPGDVSLLSDDEFDCGLTGDQPCGDGHFPYSMRADYELLREYAACPDNGCVEAGLRLEFAFPWSDLGLEPGQPFSHHLSSAREPWPENEDYANRGFWDNLGGLAGGAGSSGYTCHELYPESVLFATPGDVVEHLHELENLGNRDEAFKLRMSSSEGFPLRLSLDLNFDGTATADEWLCFDANGDGDFEDPGDEVFDLGDGDMDGQCDSGVLAGVRSSIPGDAIPLILGVEVPVDVSSGTVDRSFVEACAPNGRVETVNTRTDVGLLIASPDLGVTAGPGVTVPYEHVLLNASGFLDAVSISIDSSLGWNHTLRLDADCDGISDAVLTTDITVDPDDFRCLILEITVPTDAPLGSVDVTTALFTSGNDPGVTTGFTDVTTVGPLYQAGPSYTVANGRAKFGTPGSTVLFPHRIVNNDSEPVPFTIGHRGEPGGFLTDPDCDGNPADGEPHLLGETPPVDPFGGVVCYVLALETFDLMVGEVSTTRVDIFEATTPVFLPTLMDEIIVSQVVAYADPLRILSATDYQSCDNVYAGAAGLEPNRLDRYLFEWENPAGVLAQHDVVTSDILGEAIAELELPVDAIPGTWLLRISTCSDPFLPDGTCPADETLIDEIGFQVNVTTAIASLGTDPASFPLVSPVFRGLTQVLNAGDRAIEGSILEHVILTPARDEYLTAAGDFAPYTGVELTRRRVLPTIAIAEVFADAFAVLNVAFPAEAPDYVIETSWELACGAPLGAESSTFAVGDPCGPDSDGDGIGNACDNCPLIPNADQADVDGNGVGDACECPAGGMPPAAGPGDGLRAIGVDEFTWPILADATTYPVLRGTIPRDGGLATRGPGAYDHACLTIVTTPGFLDASDPPPGMAGFYYLVGAGNSCGQSADLYGTDSSGLQRPDLPCP
ncbi:MAG: thrombospondin type 3 repeat-containing protein [Acidobacteriota bacterium]